MPLRRPWIAMPAYTPPAGRVRSVVGDGFAVPEHYVHAVERAGGRCLMLSAFDEDAAGALEFADGLLLLGGGDIEAARYGQATHPTAYGHEPARDGFELAVLAAARERDLPVLAVCRGLEIVNVASGGTLHQHLAPTDVLHRSADGALTLHPVHTRPSRLQDLCGTRLQACSSRHHQAVDAIGDGLMVTAVAQDGTIEGLEPADSDEWLVAVQWHPEDTAASDEVQQRLFDAFVRAAVARGHAARRAGFEPARPRS